MKRRGLTVILATTVFLGGVLPTNGWANESYYQATSQLELENIIFSAIHQRETAFKVRYSGEASDIKGLVRIARDKAVARDPYDESSISLISGFKISSSPGQADISFEGFQYFTTAEQEQYVDQQVERIAGEVITEGMTEQAKLQAVHTYIINHVDYDDTLAGYTAYSALKDGVTVCNGYVQLAYKLLNRVGIETKMVKGTVITNGNPKDHAWVLVKIGGVWYHLDPTLNDTQAGAGTYKYYALSDTDISVDHSFNHADYPAAPQTYPKNQGNDTPTNPGREPSGSSSGGTAPNTTRYFVESVSGTAVRASLDVTQVETFIAKSEAALGIYELAVVSKGDSYEISLPVTVLDKLAAKNPRALLRVTTSLGGYELPVQGIRQGLNNEGIQDSGNEVFVHITKVTGNEATKVNQLVKQAGWSLVSDPVQFVLQVEHKGSKRTLQGLKQFVQRSLMVSTSNQAVGLMYSPTQERLVPVPTGFASSGNQKIANLATPKDGIFLVATTKPVEFTDLSGHWAKSNVERMAGRLIVQGKDTRRFDPQGQVTRAEFAAILVRALGLTPEGSNHQSTGQQVFTDVTTGWYVEPVSIAMNSGLITGHSDGTFRPQGAITRQEMAVMINRAMSLADKEVTLSGQQVGLDKFADQGQIKDWAKDAVAKANYAKIIQGNQFGNFAPQALATRAEAVTMLDRALRYMEFIE